MRWLGIDPGDKHIGVAVSDPTGLIARPLLTLTHVSYAESAARLVHLAAEQQAEGLVIGLPLDEEGEVGPQARKAVRLAEAVRARTTLRVEMHDESLTSRDAQAWLLAGGGTRRARQAKEHAAAAAALLQSYLDAHSSETPPG